MTGVTRAGSAPAEMRAEELANLIDRAFDYRGDVTVVLPDGRERVGYVFNRDAEVERPFLQMFPASGGGSLTIAYAEVVTVRFTGKDTAAGNSYAAWLERRAAARTEKMPAPDA